MKNIDFVFIVFLIFIFTCANNASAQQFQKQNPVITIAGEVRYNAADGGLTSPLFDSYDLDGDGTDELIVYDKTGENFIVYRLDHADNTYKIWLSPPIKFPAISNWAILKDYNKDGIVDMFAYPDIGPGGFQIWKGRKDNGITYFDLVQLNQGDFNILYFQSQSSCKLNIYVSSADVADITDIDSDGDLDIFTFNPDGNYLEFYQNQSIEKGYGTDSLLYFRADRCYGKFIESGLTNQILLSNDPNTCANNVQDPEIDPRHAGSSTLIYDVNRDGIADILIGDVSFEEVSYLQNTGTNTKAFITQVDDDFPPGDIKMRLGPFPAISHLKLYNAQSDYLIFSNNTGKLTNEDKMTWIYRHEPDNHFTLIDSNFLRTNTVDLGIGFHPAIADINGDGKPDILAGNDLLNTAGNYVSGLSYFQNESTTNEFKFRLVDNDFLGLKQLGSSNYAYQPCIGDLDKDGYPDLLVGNIQGYIIRYESTTKPPEPLNFVDLDDHYAGLKVPSRSSPTIIDFDNDGDNDILIGDRNGQFALYVNTGNATNPEFHPKFNEAPNVYPYGGINVKGAGELEGNATAATLLLQGNNYILSGSMSGRTALYGPISPDPGAQLSLHDCCLPDEYDGRGSHPIMADLNGDGWLELIKGNLRGGFNIYTTGINTDGSVNSIASDQTNLIQLYPTLLASGQSLHIESDLPLYQAVIYDLSGKIVANYNLQNIKESGLQLNLQPGLYPIVVWSKNGFQKVFKVFIAY